MAVFCVPMVTFQCSQMVFSEDGDFEFSWEHMEGSMLLKAA